MANKTKTDNHAFGSVQHWDVHACHFKEAAWAQHVVRYTYMYLLSSQLETRVLLCIWHLHDSKHFGGNPLTSVLVRVNCDFNADHGPLQPSLLVNIRVASGPYHVTACPLHLVSVPPLLYLHGYVCMCVYIYLHTYMQKNVHYPHDCYEQVPVLLSLSFFFCYNKRTSVCWSCMVYFFFTPFKPTWSEKLINMYSWCCGSVARDMVMEK